MRLPMCIDTLRLSGGGRIGMGPCPGRWRLFGTIGAERGGIEQDLAVIRRWGALALVSLVELDELDMLGIEDMASTVHGQQLDWYHLPIADFHAPGPDFERAWTQAGPEIHRRLHADQALVVHCLAGLGRTGTVVARILVERGLEPAEAVATVRSVRPGAIQSPEQESYVLERRWETAPSPPLPAYGG